MAKLLVIGASRGIGLETVKTALRAGHTHYTPALGLPALREALAGHYRDRFGLDLDPARVNYVNIRCLEERGHPP